MDTECKIFFTAENTGRCSLCQSHFVRNQELVELESKQDGLKVTLDMKCYGFLKKVL